MSEQEQIADELSQLIVSIAAMPDECAGVRREILDLQASLGPLATQEQRADMIREFERVISHNQPARHQVEHVNGGTISVVDKTCLNDAKLEVILCLERCIGVVQYEVVRQKVMEDKYGSEHIIQTRMYIFRSDF